MALELLYNDWKIQKANTYEPGRVFNNRPFSLSRKMNGIRATYFMGDLVSANGRKIVGFKDIEEQCRKLRQQFDLPPTLDGELVYIDPTGKMTDMQCFEYAKGIATASKDFSKKHKLTFVIFDYVEENVFANNGKSNMYLNRLNTIENIFNRMIKEFNLNKLDTIKSIYEGKDVSQIEILGQKAFENDWEGLVLNLDVPYCFGRSPNVWKHKIFQTADLKIIGFKQEFDIRGNSKDQIGAIECKHLDCNNFDTILVQGIDRDLKIAMWKDPAAYYGRTIEVKYKSITYNKQTGLNSLQFPTFLGFREDK